MNILAAIVLGSLLFLLSGNGFSQSKIDPKDIKDKMQWFGDAKLSILYRGHGGLLIP